MNISIAGPVISEIGVATNIYDYVQLSAKEIFMFSPVMSGMDVRACLLTKMRSAIDAYAG